LRHVLAVREAIKSSGDENCVGGSPAPGCMQLRTELQGKPENVENSRGGLSAGPKRNGSQKAMIWNTMRRRVFDPSKGGKRPHSEARQEEARCDEDGRAPKNEPHKQKKTKEPKKREGRSLLSQKADTILLIVSKGGTRQKGRSRRLLKKKRLLKGKQKKFAQTL